MSMNDASKRKGIISSYSDRIKQSGPAGKVFWGGCIPIVFFIAACFSLLVSCFLFFVVGSTTGLIDIPPTRTPALAVDLVATNDSSLPQKTLTESPTVLATITKTAEPTPTILAPTQTIEPTPTQINIDGALVETSEWKVTLEKAVSLDSIPWKEERLKAEGHWLVITGQVQNLTNRTVFVHGRDFFVTSPLLDENIRLNGDATGGAGLDLDVPSTVAGFLGLEVPAGKTLPLVLAFDVPDTVDTAELNIDGQQIALGSVTEIALAPTPTSPPSPTLPPPPTPVPTVTPTSTPVPPSVTVAKRANVRDLPNTEGSQVIDQVDAGESVVLRMRTPDSSWFSTLNARGIVGWINAGLLTIDPAIIESVPQGETDDEIGPSLARATSTAAARATAEAIEVARLQPTYEEQPLRLLRQQQLNLTDLNLQKDTGMAMETVYEL